MKRLFTFALLLALSFPVLAEHVDQQKAEKVAETVLLHKNLTPMSMEAFHNLYVFNGDHSFVVIAADDCARPVLAYSKEFSFQTMQMPENVLGWMASLNDEIQDAVDRGLVATEETSREWELLSQGIMPEPKNRTEVNPLIKTHWDQYEPYNNMCPDGSLTGCVATAMAQIMKYWEWPRMGTGSHSYDHDTYGMQYVNFGVTLYDWDNMKEMVFYDSPMLQQNAVSTLMYHCGVSVDMNYSPDGSGAFSDKVPTALTTYFDFNPTDIRWQPASDYDAAGWVSCLKAELDLGRPLYYSGKSDDGGHAFICDGYDANDYLHFNWGWGGYCDGYYAYGALDPGTGGAGSGAGTYNNLNYAMIGAYPNMPPIAAPTDLSATVSDRAVTLSWSPVSGASYYKVYSDGFVINKNVSNTSYIVSDAVYGHHTYFVRAVNASGVYSLRSEEVPVEVTYSGPVVSDLRAQVNGQNVTLSWTAPACETAQLKYGDGTASSSSYGDPEGRFTWGQRYTPEELSPYAGMAITSVDMFSWVVDEYVLTIYRETEDEVEVLLSGAFTNPESGWCRISLSTPIPIDYENELLISFSNDGNVYPYVAAFTEDYEGGNNASLYLEDGYWYTMDYAISWLIRANITDDTYTYSLYRNDQQIAANITQTSYSDNNLPEGTYQYTVRTQYYDALSDPSGAVQVVIGSSTGENDDSRLAVYPNPTSGKVIVRGEQMEYIEVVSLTGQQFATIRVDNDNAEVDLAAFHPGVYVLVIHTRDGAKNVIRISKR